MSDTVNNPQHYDGPACECGRSASCIKFAEGLPFNHGNALKYVWRAGRKGDAVEDLNKAKWYIEREIMRLEQQAVRFIK